MKKEDQIAILSQEADHYYSAELSHDQRCGWLIAICIGMLAITSVLAIKISSSEISGNLFLINSCTFFLVSSLFVTLISLWPLKGAGKIWLPNYSNRQIAQRQPIDLFEIIDESWVVKHYYAHKSRAVRKVKIIIWSFLFLGIAVVFFLLSIFSL